MDCIFSCQRKYHLQYFGIIITLYLFFGLYFIPDANPAEPVEIILSPAGLSLFPQPDLPATLTVYAKRTAAGPHRLNCEVILQYFGHLADCGYKASERQTISLPVADEWGMAQFQIEAAAERVPMLNGKIFIENAPGEPAFSCHIPIRMGRDVLAFLEQREFGAGEEQHAEDVNCLENAWLRMEWLAQLGCLLTLRSAVSGVDFLCPGDALTGWWVAGTANWNCSDFEPPGVQAKMILTERVQGDRVTLQAGLTNDSDTASLNVDWGNVSMIPGPVGMFLTTSPKEGDLIRLNGGDSLTPDLQGLQMPVMGTCMVEYWLAQTDETLQIYCQCPALSAVAVQRQEGDVTGTGLWFEFNGGAPGQMDWSFRIVSGQFPQEPE